MARQDVIYFESHQEDSDDSTENAYIASLKGLEYTENSCYIDSVFMALFSTRNKAGEYILLDSPRKKNISKLQNEIEKISESIQGKEQVRDVSKFREVLETVKEAEQFHNLRKQDSGEFLMFLFNIFNVSLMKYKRCTYITNNIEDTPEDLIKIHEEITIIPPIISIPAFSLEAKDEVDLRNFINTTDDTFLSADNLYLHEQSKTLYQRRIETNKILSTPCIIFNVQRLLLRSLRLVNEVICPESILVNGKRLYLHAIVVHQNRHYTCYIRSISGNFPVWFYYNDLKSGRDMIKSIGTYEKMLESNPNPKSLGTLYFYSRL